MVHSWTPIGDGRPVFSGSSLIIPRRRRPSEGQLQAQRAGHAPASSGTGSGAAVEGVGGGGYSRWEGNDRARGNKRGKVGIWQMAQQRATPRRRRWQGEMGERTAVGTRRPSEDGRRGGNAEAPGAVVESKHKPPRYRRARSLLPSTEKLQRRRVRTTINGAHRAPGAAAKSTLSQRRVQPQSCYIDTSPIHVGQSRYGKSRRIPPSVQSAHLCLQLVQPARPHATAGDLRIDRRLGPEVALAPIVFGYLIVLP